MTSKTILLRGLLLFWSAWLSLVFASNAVDGLQQAGIAPESWSFTSGNFSLIVETVAVYGLPAAFAAVLFVAVLILELMASVLFWRAFVDRGATTVDGMPKVLQAFVPAIGLFAGFLIADELFIVYHRIPSLESSHFLALCALLLSLVAIKLLRDD